MKDRKKAGKEVKTDELIKIYEELIAQTRKETAASFPRLPGREKPRLFAIMEEWRVQDALDRNLRTEHFLTLCFELNELTEVRFDPERYFQII
jgi:quinol monooxygenase YgiN